jgi:hypothetical protein
MSYASYFSTRQLSKRRRIKRTQTNTFSFCTLASVGADLNTRMRTANDHQNQSTKCLFVLLDLLIWFASICWHLRLSLYTSDRSLLCLRVRWQRNHRRKILLIHLSSPGWFLFQHSRSAQGSEKIVFVLLHSVQCAECLLVCSSHCLSAAADGETARRAKS